MYHIIYCTINICNNKEDIATCIPVYPNNYVSSALLFEYVYAPGGHAINLYSIFPDIFGASEEATAFMFLSWAYKRASSHFSHMLL